MQERKTYIDIAKGLCIILVVLGHILQYNFIGSGADSAFNFIYSFHMPAFMMLSGYVSAFSVDGFAIGQSITFVKKKFISLLLPYLTWGLMVTPFILHTYDGGDYVNYIVRLITNPLSGAWFIAVLFSIQLFFLLFCIARNIFKKYITKGLLLDVVCGVLVLVFMGMIEFTLKKYDSESRLYFSSKYFIFFMSGYFASRHLQSIVENKCCVAFSTLLFSILVNLFVFNKTNDIVVLVLGLSASVIILNVSKYIESVGKNKYLALFGKESLTIYLMHYIFVQFLAEGYGGGTNGCSGAGLFLLLLIPAIIICWTCVHIGKWLSSNTILKLFLFGKIK